MSSSAEFALVKAAFYTEPQDQSAWLYHRWLLGRVLAPLPALPSLLIALGHDFPDGRGEVGEKGETSGSVDVLGVLERELGVCRELDGVEADCKWILLTLALLISAREAVRLHQRAGAGGMGGEYPPEAVEEVASLFQRLISLDPMRTQYYRDVHASLSRARPLHTEHE